MSTTTIRRRPVPECAAPLHANALIHRVLAARGVVCAEELSVALADLPGVASMPGIDAATERLLQARAAGERILIVGDYDCDGATSTAVAMLGLRGLGFSALDYFIPNRFVHGYGLSPAIVDIARERDSRLILTVDNGVASVEGVEHAHGVGIDVIVTDHHLPPTVLPTPAALVNPNLVGSRFPGRNLAGVGVMFYVLLALRAALGSAAPKYKLAPLLDLVAIGTVADVVPLDRINRTLVEQGLRRIRAGHGRTGVKALLAVAGREAEHLSATDIGFSIGPRLNAAGRIDEMRTGVQCLLAEDPVVAHRLASELDSLNQQRRRIESDMRGEADEQLAALGLQPENVQDRFAIALFDARWHQGVIGILAGRLKEHLHRPVAVFTDDKVTDSQAAGAAIGTPGKAPANRGPADIGADTVALIKGSVRSIPGVHVRDVIDSIAVANPGLVLRFGGHAMAAGLTIERAAFDTFSRRFEEAVQESLQGLQPTREWWVDGVLVERERHLCNALLLERLLPWGQGFEAPRFDGQFMAKQVRVVGNGHLKLSLQPLATPQMVEVDLTSRYDGYESNDTHEAQEAPHRQDFGGRYDEPEGSPIEAIAFNPTQEVEPGQRLRVVYALGVNRYRGNTVLQLEVKHMECV